MWEVNNVTDTKGAATDRAEDKRQKFKHFHQEIYQDIEKSTNDFLEFAEEKGAFEWQAGAYSPFDVDFGHLARPEAKSYFSK